MVTIVVAAMAAAALRPRAFRCLPSSRGSCDSNLHEPPSHSPPMNWPSMLAAAWAGLSDPT